MQKIHVLNRNGEKLFDAEPAQAARMLALHQVRRTGDRRCLVVTGFDRQHEHECRTHTSRSAMLGAIGRSQEYTIRERGRVTGFKRIFPEDRNIFRAAVIECMAAALRRLNITGEVYFCEGFSAGSIILDSNILAKAL